MLALPLGQWAVVVLASGVLAAVLMNIPMYVQPEGYRPAYVAAAGATRRDPGEVGPAAAAVAHHVAGVAAAVLYGGLTFALAAVLPTLLPLNGVPAVPHLVGVLAVTLFVYAFFERVALPRAGGSFREDADPIVRQWALSAFIYGVTLALVVPVLVTQL
ncbi:hypothetical protein [Haloarcula litorea]|uniref:hypothetical protein n=1 Tax=Haloarcula litorea TaxID=3032579 RepID=UPI0023E82B82|nr:hypothetical protein [Halomicroarcula sp. GDY20]